MTARRLRFLAAAFALAAAVAPRSGAAPPEVVVGDVRGVVDRFEQTSGASRLLLRTNAGPIDLPVDSVERLQFAPPVASPPGPRAGFRDGSIWNLAAAGDADQAGRVRLRTAAGLERTIPYSELAWLAFEPIGGPAQAVWDEELARKGRTEDVVVIRRGGDVDSLPGVVAGLSDDSVDLQLGTPGGDSIPVPRSRVIGVVFAASGGAAPSPYCRVELAGGSTLTPIEPPQVGEDALTITDSLGAVSLDWDQVVAIDFAAVRATKLESLTPESQRFTASLWPGRAPSYLVAWNRPQTAGDGAELRLGFDHFDAGLVVESGQDMVYRLSRRYRRFEATVGIDRETSGQATAVLVLEGDGRELARRTVSSTEKPESWEVDVSGVGLLRLTVVVGDDGPWGDRVVIAEARLQR